MATTNARWALSGITGVDLIHLLASIGSRNKMANFVSPNITRPGVRRALCIDANLHLTM